MAEVTVIIPNYNGLRFLPCLMESLERQTCREFEVILVDNGSTDQSTEYLRERWPWVKLISFPENTGFSHAVNAGIQASTTDYVILLNNDTEADPEFVQELLRCIRSHPDAFSVCARMICFDDRGKLDGAGDLYCALGWAFARGRGKDAGRYPDETRVFAACAGAAVYRRRMFDEIGLFDDEHFAYLEDLDIGYRARIYGYENWYAPRAVVYHVGSGTSGGTYNQFKIRYSSRNNIYLIYKNMPALQILLNLVFLAAGFAVKAVFFTARGMGREYLAGIKNGFQICRRDKKVPFRRRHLGNYLRIQLELWLNMIRRLPLF